MAEQVVIPEYGYHPCLSRFHVSINSLLNHFRPPKIRKVTKTEKILQCQQPRGRNAAHYEKIKYLMIKLYHSSGAKAKAASFYGSSRARSQGA